ncbi:hypothetical protein PENTCL1PPCAC_6503 [Pristionchus entomophagus]|uniref:TAR DNA-binding protein 43 N-terminal domain-containing protein n=1 Tax=Pristionchus entomophagus TaxID=358040 RepID=A0AAV5SUM5_9BILA|nr:hypothetical protein PENTCL1PPCAC_6503 [Pristionchus entomophagus]
MSSIVAKVRTVRVFVEPIEVELDEDGGLQWSSLASAFPGCSNLYYKGEENLKTMVKFDGKKFVRGSGCWNDTTYYVTLGSRTMNYPFGSYENASKQFEKSVNAVQQMLGGSLFAPKKRENGVRRSVEKSPVVNGIENGEKKEEVTVSLQERELLLKSSSSSRKLSPIEEQFVDLARISNGKDSVIEGQREELTKMKTTMAELEKDVTKYGEECSRHEKRMMAMEEELNILRRLSKDQTNMCEKVADLTSRLSDRELEFSSVRNDLNEKLSKLRMEKNEMEQKLDSASTQLRDSTSKWHLTEEDLKLKTMEVYEMELELKRLRTLAKRVNVDSVEQIQCYTETMDENAKLREEQSNLREDLSRQKESHLLFEKNALENARLMERNSEMEQRFNNLTIELGKINEKWKNTLTQREEEWSTKRAELELEKVELRRQIIELQSMFESATRDVAETTRRLDEVMASREEMRKYLNSIEYKHQDDLNRQTRGLAERAEEAEKRVTEMANMITSLTQENHDRLRDVHEVL